MELFADLSASLFWLSLQNDASSILYKLLHKRPPVNINQLGQCFSMLPVAVAASAGIIFSAKTLSVAKAAVDIDVTVL